MNYPTNDQLQEISFNANNIPNAIKLTVDLFKQLNPDPVKPEFDKKFRYCAKDLTGEWFIFASKPIWNDHNTMWINELAKSLSNCEEVTNSDKILWLEHINAGRPPEDSLIKLGDYK